ncbi:MAG: type II secretion system protein, partial [Candidatus Melainabacteria bacterium]|nr:type II secretion system protein [Candidatus Melainabacteria bacterium]
STKHQAPSTKHQAPSTKHHKPFKGFTLSELLVSLAVLGLIAGLTVPSIINSVQVAKKRALLKESLQLISSIVQAGVLNGDFQNITTFDIVNQNGPGSITNYFTSKLNAKQCVKPDGSKDLLSKGCDRAFNNATSDAHVDHYGKWLLPNGVRISLSSQNWTNVRPLSFHIITDAYSTYDLSWIPEKRTVFTFHCNTTDTPSPREGDSTLTKPGMCQPFSSTEDVLTSKALGLT